MANLAGITRQIITLTEQGVYPEIPPAIIKTIKTEFGPLAARELPQEHSAWIKSALDATDISLWLNTTDPDRLPVGKYYGIPVQSFVEWRDLISDSVSNFGKIVKIQPVTIRKYESGATHNLPVQLVERLQHWGFSDLYIKRVSELPITGANQHGGGRR